MSERAERRDLRVPEASAASRLDAPERSALAEQP